MTSIFGAFFRIVAFSVTLIFVSLLIISLALIHGIQLISLLLLLLSPTQFRKLNANLAAFWWYLLTRASERLCGVQVELLGTQLNQNIDQAIVISNHQSLVDSLILLILARDQGKLSYLKWFVKKPLLYVPFLGWGLWFLDCIFVERKWEQDQKKLASSFDRIRNHPGPLWLISFVEGTRKTNLKLGTSREFAIKNGLPPFKNVLFPRSKGFIASIQNLENRIESIYDLTIRYSHPKPTIGNLLKGHFGKVYVFAEEIKIHTLKTDPLPLKEWLITRFRIKDELLEKFYSDAP